jgi:hypothetical protein
LRPLVLNCLRPGKSLQVGIVLNNSLPHAIEERVLRCGAGGESGNDEDCRKKPHGF